MSLFNCKFFHYYESSVQNIICSLLSEMQKNNLLSATKLRRFELSITNR